MAGEPCARRGDRGLHGGDGNVDHEAPRRRRLEDERPHRTAQEGPRGRGGHLLTVDEHLNLAPQRHVEREVGGGLGRDHANPARTRHVGQGRPAKDHPVELQRVVLGPENHAGMLRPEAACCLPRGSEAPRGFPGDSASSVFCGCRFSATGMVLAVAILRCSRRSARSGWLIVMPPPLNACPPTREGLLT